VLTDPAARPQTVFVPALRLQPGDVEAQLVLRQVDDQLVLPVYSSLERLLAGCGSQSAWVSIRADVLDQLLPQLGDPVVLLDVPLAPQDRETGL
jgi:hypothetical protein